MAPGGGASKSNRGTGPCLTSPLLKMAFRESSPSCILAEIGRFRLCDVDPNFGLNFGVPDLSKEEGIAARYMQTKSKIVPGGRSLWRATGSLTTACLKMSLYSLILDRVGPSQRVIGGGSSVCNCYALATNYFFLVSVSISGIFD